MVRDEKWKIGDVVLDNRLILGPMAGVTDLVFRRLCEEQGCGAAYTEMVSAKAVFYHGGWYADTADRMTATGKTDANGPDGRDGRSGHERDSRGHGGNGTFELMRVGDWEKAVALQLFGSDAEILSDMAARLAAGPYAWIDVNMGCPVPKIVRNGEGSALMREPAKAERILTELVRKVKKPVTVKFRKAFNDHEGDAVEFARMAEACGVAAVAVHGRTREQFYSGEADWDVIRRVKEAVKIPVIGNGDVRTPRDAARMMEETGCDGVMIARGARGNPWIFSRTLAYLRTGTVPPPPSAAGIREMILRHARLLIEDKGEMTAIREMRKHVAWYTAGLPYSSALRGEMNRVTDYQGLLAALDKAGELEYNTLQRYRRTGGPSDKEMEER